MDGAPNYSGTMRYFRGILCMTAIVAATLVVGFSGQGWGRGARAEPAVEALPLPAADAHASLDMIGARTCASTACHGSVRRDPRSQGAFSEFIRRDEYVFWSDHDPHARSLLTLDSERSHIIYARLGIKDAQGKVLDQRAYDNCRACHATKVSDPVTQTVSFESVSCEACHGPAEVWRDAHYQRSWNEQVAARRGFANTKDLTVRAGQCVQCHVGAADREVNHDLIAAGHPVLKFELAAYHDMLPKHWNDHRERTRATDFELALWNVGQQQTAQAALALTHARLARLQDMAHAERSPVKPVWPEFAEYDCFACHHDLVDSSWYRAQEKDPGVLAAWNTWNFAGLARGRSARFDELKTQMPQQLRNADEGLLAKVAAAQQEVAGLRFQGELQLREEAPMHWDNAAQAYLQLAASFRARQDAARQTGHLWPQEAQVKQQLLEVRQLLAFEPQFDSPRTNAVNVREQVAAKLKAIEALLSQDER